MNTGFLGDLIDKIPGVGAVADAIKNPALLSARLQVVQGLTQCKVCPFCKIGLVLLALS